MLRKLKNRAAIALLIRQLTGIRSFDSDKVRIQCKSLVYACFLMGIEPFQLPITDSFSGDLSASQKRDFLQQYLSLHTDSTNRFKAASQILTSEPAWLSLVQLVDEILDQQKIYNRTSTYTDMYEPASRSGAGIV